MTELNLHQALQLAANHHANGQLDLAESIYRQVLEVDAQNADALHLLGVIATQVGQYGQAVLLIRQSLGIAPQNSVAMYNLGCALQKLERRSEALAAYEGCVSLNSNHTEAHNNLGFLLAVEKRFDDAIRCFRRALELNPNYAQAHQNFAAALVASGQAEASVDHFKRAIALDPSNSVAYYDFGNLLGSRGHLDEAIACFERAVAIRPDFPQAWNNLANAYHNQGNVDKAIAAFREALRINPDQPDVHSNLLMTLYTHPDYDGPEILREHLAFSDRHCARLYAQITEHTNDPNPNRRLRIGFVSGDLCNHPVGRSMAHLLPYHDRAVVEIFCYSSTPKDNDETARALREQTGDDHWRDVRNCSPEEVAHQVRDDAIDILVDLSLHSAHNQLLAFALKPAPIQVTYLAYPGTSGLKTIDYHVTDRFLDPPGQHDSHYTEQLVTVHHWCYQPPLEALTCDVGPLPADENSFVTFGSLNNFIKISPAVLQLWARVLASVPDSRLLLHCPPGSHRANVTRIFAEAQVSADRIEFVGRVPLRDYFALFSRIDIVLDPFPYGGGTTACEAIYMGCPIITLKGRTSVSRMGFSSVAHVGLLDLAAESPDEYVRIASALAADIPRLRRLRQSLRQTLLSSTIVDCPSFAREMEHLYREFWKRWCDGAKAKNLPRPLI